MTTREEAQRLADALEPVSAYGRVGTRDVDQAVVQQAVRLLRQWPEAGEPVASIRAIADAMPYTHAEVRKILDGMVMVPRKELGDGISLLHQAMVGSCDCLTKTHEAQYHAENCFYRKLSEKCDKLEAALAAAPQAVPFDRTTALVLLQAASKSGDPGAISLAAQLAGAAPCKDCGYVNVKCRCAKTAPQAVPRRVRKIGGSFQHTGTVVAQFTTTAGEPRIVLEFDAPVAGMLHVYRPDQVEAALDAPQAVPQPLTDEQEKAQSAEAKTGLIQHTTPDNGSDMQSGADAELSGNRSAGSTPPCPDTAWLIEWQAHGYGPQWWGFNHTPGRYSDWCSDANNAIRFSRREDAERMRLHVIAVAGFAGRPDYQRQVTVTEHMWPAAVPQAVPQPEPEKRIVWCTETDSACSTCPTLRIPCQAATQAAALNARVTVPREPTQEMIAAGEAVFRSYCFRHVNGAIPTYEAMIAAAPAPAVPEVMAGPMPPPMSEADEKRLNAALTIVFDLACGPADPTMMQDELVAAAESIGMRFPAPAVPDLKHKPTVQRLMDLARKFRSAPGDLYDGAYKELQSACYEALSAAPAVREPQDERIRWRDAVIKEAESALRTAEQEFADMPTWANMGHAAKKVTHALAVIAAHGIGGGGK